MPTLHGGFLYAGGGIAQKADAVSIYNCGLGVVGSRELFARHALEARMDALMIRSARLEDSSALAALSEQLGYPTTAEAVKVRLPRYLDSNERRVIVAELDGQVVGWTSIEVVDHFYIEKFAEISGFVVEATHRGRGIGHAIMAEAERWASGKGLSILKLKTNVIRTEAHHFYENLGFLRTKTQYTYVKQLAPKREAQ